MSVPEVKPGEEAVFKALTGFTTPPPRRLTIKVGGKTAAAMNAQKVRYTGNRQSRRRNARP